MWIYRIGSRPEQFISRVLFPPRVTPWRATIIPLRVPVARHLMRPTRELGRATLERSSIWSCTGWGLPSFPGHPGNWCALTAPFHPYLWDKFSQRRFAFCCTFLRVATTPRYGAPCPVVFGLSSGPVTGRRSSDLLRPILLFPIYDSVAVGAMLQAVIPLQIVVHLRREVHVASAARGGMHRGNP